VLDTKLTSTTLHYDTDHFAGHKLRLQVPTEARCLKCDGWAINVEGFMCWSCNGTGTNFGRYYQPPNWIPGQFNPYSQWEGVEFDVKADDGVVVAPTQRVQQDQQDRKVSTLLAELMAPVDLKEEVIDLSNTLFLGDSVRTILPLWPTACVDHIFTDAPYGIDVANMQQAATALMDVSRVEATHDVGENLDLFAAMMPVFYRLLKEGGFFVTFCDEWNFRLLGDLAASAGFGVQRWSLHWEKTSPCKCQMAHVLTTKDHEIAIVCRKGAARLPAPVTTSRILCPNDADRASNPFAKPFSAWKFIYESFSIPGQTILEPFAGEGSGVTAGIRLNRRVLAVEKDEAHYNYLLEGVKGYWQGVFKKVRFV
jgi:site-specific DNA-methyltransferase (adenine-specific)